MRFIAIILVVFLAGCSKYATPKKVEKRLTQGTWRIVEAFSDGQNITASFNGVKFIFSENKSLSMTSDSFSTSGSWSLGVDKNPTLFNLSLPVTQETEFLADDWLIYEISKTECFMKRNDPSLDTDRVLFRKIE
jgi:hypothetical protein